MIKLNGHLVTPTLFPDGTSQVWKLPEAWFKYLDDENQVEWIFENEAELIHVCQLGDLLKGSAQLYMPFLPYGRQDKKVSNETTFALDTFLTIIDIFYPVIQTLDAHSKSSICDSIYPAKEIKFAIESTGCTSVCFPDKGAKARYNVELRNIILDKVRDQSTGEITGLAIAEGTKHAKGANILIIDDICDGGRTFIEAAKLLYKWEAKEVNLYTTHGLYTKGLDCLREAGIKRIFNYKGEV